MTGRYIVLAIGMLGLMLLSLRESNDDSPTPSTVIPIDSVSTAESSSQSRTISGVDSKPVSSKGWKPAQVVPLSGLTRGKLKEFSSLKKKVFLTNDDKRRLSELTRDPSFLSSLAPLFDIAAKRDENDLNAAIDLLLDAATKEKSETAASVLMGVIADSSIEDQEIPTKARESLSGIKAEIMFLWTAATPERANHMEAMLPGPVSRRLWENVLRAQDRNRNESLASQSQDD